jgi:hypothetical protein
LEVAHAGGRYGLGVGDRMMPGDCWVGNLNVRAGDQSTVTLLARLRGLSMSRPRARAVW